MKKPLLIAGIVTTLLGACIKSTIPIPPPPPSSGSGGSSGASGSSGTVPTWPMGISGVLNGVYTTFNRNMTLDTTGIPATGVQIYTWCDSAQFGDVQLAFGFSNNAGSIVPALYAGQPNGSTYSSGITVNVISQSDPAYGFPSYDDSIYVTYVSDSTFAGTISGTFVGNIETPLPPYNYDSTLSFTNIRFYLKW
jgi:hypothetical protein